MTPLNQLQQDQAAIENILRAHHGVTIVTAHPAGVQILLKMYFMILEDAISTLGSLIEFLTPKVDHE